MSDMKRLSAYLPDPVFEKLDEWAAEEKRSLSNLVAYLLERAIEERDRGRADHPTSSQPGGKNP